MNSLNEHHFQPGEKRRIPFVAPVDIRLGPHDLLKVIDPRRDIHPDIASQFASLAEALLVAPSQFDYQGAKGYEDLWTGEPIVVGRQNEGRIEFSTYTSNEHVELELSENTLTVHDLGSRYGTLARWAVSSASLKSIPNAQEVEHRPENYRVMVYGATKKSEMRPGNFNDDHYFIDTSNGTVGVFDGVGGMPGSSVASSIAASSAQNHLHTIAYIQPRSSANKHVEEAALYAHHAIIAQQEADKPVQTTATIAKVFLDSQTKMPFVSIATVGDSRAYLYRNNRLEVITTDQGIYSGEDEEDRRHMQDVLSEVVDIETLSRKEQTVFKNRHFITGALGGYEQNPPVISLDVDVQKGDRLILTTDGIHDNLTTSELQRYLALIKDDEDISSLIVAAAQERSRDRLHLRAKPDDMTVALMTIN